MRNLFFRRPHPSGEGYIWPLWQSWLHRRGIALGTPRTTIHFGRRRCEVCQKPVRFWLVQGTSTPLCSFDCFERYLVQLLNNPLPESNNG